MFLSITCLLNDLPEARKWAKRSLEMQGDDAETWYDLGRIDYSSGNLEAAYDCFGRALKLLPGSVKVEDNLASHWKDSTVRRKPLLRIAAPLHRSRMRRCPRSSHFELGYAAHPSFRSQRSVASSCAGGSNFAGEIQRSMSSLANSICAGKSTGRSDRVRESCIACAQDAPLHFLLGQVCHRAGMNEEAKKEFAIAARLNGTLH